MGFDGTYHVTVKTPLGSQKGKLIIETDGNSFSGRMESPLGESRFSGGNIEGNELTWRANTKTPMGAFDVAFHASIVGDKLTGKAQTPFGSAPIEGTRV